MKKSTQDTITDKTTAIAAIVKCPQCKVSVAWSQSNKYRPFCSQRCKLLDLGAWAGEGHRIEGEALEPVYNYDDEINSVD